MHTLSCGADVYSHWDVVPYENGGKRRVFQLFDANKLNNLAIGTAAHNSTEEFVAAAEAEGTVEWAHFQDMARYELLGKSLYDALSGATTGNICRRGSCVFIDVAELLVMGSVYDLN